MAAPRRNTAIEEAAPVIASLPWWGWLALAAASFAGFHFLTRLEPSPGAPLAMVGMAGQVLAPLAFFVAAAISLIAKSGGREKSRYAGEPLRKNEDARPNPDASTDTSRWSLELLRALEWKRFEMVCAGYFETLALKANVAREAADGAIDIHLYAKGSRVPGTIVQCRAWRNHVVGVKEIRGLLGAMTANRVREGAFVTTGIYATEARDLAAANNIHLIDGEDLLGKIAATSPRDQQTLLRLATEGDFTTPTCPACGVKMVQRVAGKSGESFWGCVDYPRCRLTFRI